MSKSVEFVVIIDDGVRKRHKHETVKGRVTRFAVQLEILVHDKWKVIVRYDCAHGYAHSDQYDKVDAEIVVGILQKHLSDFNDYKEAIIKLLSIQK